MTKLPTLKQLRYFAALVETKHYRKAAERLGISQPSLSLQIANLEALLQLKLVERGRAGVVLTPSGRDVLARTQRILAEAKDLVETSERMSSGFSGTIRLGSSPTLGPYLLPNVLHQVHEEYPELQLFIRDGAPRDLLDDLLIGHHDLILTQLPVQSADVTVVRLFREPLRLAVARDHQLAEKHEALDADLSGESILSLSSRYTLHTQVADLAREVGATVRQDYEGTSLDALRQMVAMNMGVTFLPALYTKSEIPHHLSDVTLVPFRKGRLTRSIGLAWRRSSGSEKMFRTFANIISSVAKSHFAGIVQVEF